MHKINAGGTLLQNSEFQNMNDAAGSSPWVLAGFSDESPCFESFFLGIHQDKSKNPVCG